jgi:O-antigen biosynthesis protein WbqP
MYRAFGKRIVDIVVAGAALVALAPVMIICAIGAKLSTPGPAIFRQQRIGRWGRPFEFYKFRSMPADTSDIASDQLGAISIRPFGRFLRRTNLDELPQLYNILRGDMSLIGPRPPIPSQADLIAMRRENGALACRPGLTGLAQVNSFDGMTAARKAAYDGEYAKRISLVGDAMIVIRTFCYLTRPPPRY